MIRIASAVLPILTATALAASPEPYPAPGDLIVRDDFSDLAYTLTHWNHEGTLEIDSEQFLKLDCDASNGCAFDRNFDRLGNPNGDILCLGPGGGLLSHASLWDERSVHARWVFDLSRLDLANGASFHIFALTQGPNLVAAVRLLRDTAGSYHLQLLATDEGFAQRTSKPRKLGDEPGAVDVQVAWTAADARRPGRFAAWLGSTPDLRRPYLNLSGLSNRDQHFDSLHLGLEQIGGLISPNARLLLDYAEIRRFSPIPFRSRQQSPTSRSIRSAPPSR